MKRLIIVFVLLATLFSANIFGQTDADQVNESQPLPVSIKRVNGKGTCGTAAEIRVYFDALPYPLPTIEQIRSEQRDVNGIVIINIDTSDFAKKGYISYCIISADIIPVHKLSIRFHYENTGLDYWITEVSNRAPVHH